MGRFDDADYVDQREGDAAAAIKNAAERLQVVLYYLSEDIDIPSETKAILLNCYRPLHRAVKHYYDDRHSLVFDPPVPGGFQKRKP